MWEANDKDKLRKLIENSTDIITVLNQKGEIYYESPSVERVLGFKPEEMVGRNAFEYIHADDRPQLMEIFGSTITSGTERSQAVRFRFRHREGSWIYLEAIGRVIQDEKEGLLCVINSRDVTEQVRSEVELRSLSLTDELTGLHNRRAFLKLAEQQLKMAERQKNYNILLLFCDLNDFKRINDLLGHIEGDRALIDTAKILKNVFRGVDIIARMGGDEFVVLLSEATESSFRQIRQRVDNAFKSRNQAFSEKPPLSISIGVVAYDPKTPCTIGELITLADKSMYDAKYEAKRESHG